jgi:hypothetical protein
MPTARPKRGVTIHTGIAVATTESSVAHGVPQADDGMFQLDVTVVGAADNTLDIDIEGSNDGLTWRVLGSFPTVAFGGEGTFGLPVEGIPRYVRSTATVGGAIPSLDFVVQADFYGRG